MEHRRGFLKALGAMVAGGGAVAAVASTPQPEPKPAQIGMNDEGVFMVRKDDKWVELPLQCVTPDGTKTRPSLTVKGIMAIEPK